MAGIDRELSEQEAVAGSIIGPDFFLFLDGLPEAVADLVS
jgi:hypothetical protein